MLLLPINTLYRLQYFEIDCTENSKIIYQSQIISIISFGDVEKNEDLRLLVNMRGRHSIYHNNC